MRNTIVPSLVLALWGGHHTVAVPHPLPNAQGTATSDSVQVVTCLDYLKNGQESRPLIEGFQPEHGGHWSVTRLTHLIDSRGIDFSDVNADTTWHTSVREIQREVTRRSGRSFRMLVHLAFLYSLPYRSIRPFRSHAQRRRWMSRSETATRSPSDAEAENYAWRKLRTSPSRVSDLSSRLTCARSWRRRLLEVELRL